MKGIVERHFVVCLRCPYVCPNAQLNVLDSQALENEESVLLSVCAFNRRPRRLSFCGNRRRCACAGVIGALRLSRAGRFGCRIRLRRRCRRACRRRVASGPFDGALAQPADEPHREELGVVELALGGHAGGFVLEVGKGAVALGDEKQGLESVGLLAHVVHQAHEVGLRRKVPDPDRVPCRSIVSFRRPHRRSGVRVWGRRKKGVLTTLSRLPRWSTNNI